MGNGLIALLRVMALEDLKNCLAMKRAALPNKSATARRIGY
jgi:hypothetical protein